MSTAANQTLEAVIRESGEGWLIDWFEPREHALNSIRDMLARVDARSLEKIEADPPRFNEAILIAEFESNPDRVKAFCQALGSTHSPDMLLMVWRIMQRMDITLVEMSYQRANTFSLRVTLTNPYSKRETEEYSSGDIDDAALVRHFGIMRLDGKPVFDGFFPLGTEVAK